MVDFVVVVVCTWLSVCFKSCLRFELYYYVMNELICQFFCL